jgi:hypothetical protein
VTGRANTNRAPAAMDWATLMNRPAAYVDPTRLAACFDGRIRIRLCERLRDSGRLQGRLSELIADFYALAAPSGPETVSAADQKIALLPTPRIGDVIRRAGVVYRANAIANVVRAEDVRWLRDRLGEPLYAFALANRSLSGPAGTIDLTDGADAQMTEDGARCLAAWCDAQPAAIGGRVRLKSPASPALDDAALSPFNELGPAIIRCAAA